MGNGSNPGLDVHQQVHQSDWALYSLPGRLSSSARFNSFWLFSRLDQSLRHTYGQSGTSVSFFRGCMSSDQESFGLVGLSRIGLGDPRYFNGTLLTEVDYSLFIDSLGQP